MYVRHGIIPSSYKLNSAASTLVSLHLHLHLHLHVLAAACSAACSACFRTPVSKPRPLLAMTTAYLTCYNAAQSLGWALVLVRLLHHVVESQSLIGGFSAAGNVVCFLQLAAFLEILHSVLGLVRTGTLYAFMQWLGRSHVLFAIIAKIPEVQEQPPVMITFLAWSTAEVIRYPQYALGLLGLCPHWLTWLRYTAFIVLYPIGALYGEMLAMYLSLDLIKNRNLYARSFNLWLPFDYHSFVVWVMIVYPFLWLLLYLHMFRQRRSKLAKRRSSGNRREVAKPKLVD